MEIGFDIDGFDDVQRALRALPGLVAERVQGDGLIAMARVVRDQAKISVPVRTGALRDSIRARRVSDIVDTPSGRKRVPGAVAELIVGRKGGRHWHLIEYGTVRAPAHPFLEPAFFGTRNQQTSEAIAAMARSFVRLGRQLARGTTPRVVRRLAAE